MIESKSNGHPIIFINCKWVYKDTMTPSKGNKRGCSHCGIQPTKEGYDACIGKLPNVRNACCGHGQPDNAYIQSRDGHIVRGADAVSEMIAIKNALLKMRWEK